MIRQTRSDLFSISKTCECGSICKICRAMGYSLNTNLSESKIEKLIQGINSSPSGAVVIPNASFTNAKLEEYILKFKKRIYYVFTYRFWKINHTKFSKKINPQNIAIIVDQPTELDVSIIPFDSKIHLLLNSKNLVDVLSIGSTLSAERIIHFCFPLNSLRNNFFLESNYIAENFSDPLLKNMLFSHLVPFNHDIIDCRNLNHIRWTFVPNQIYRNQLANSEIKISIIIPYCNREQLLLRVVAQISASTMNPLNFEIILIDDGSNQQQSRAVVNDIRRYNDLNIQVHYLVRNRKITTLYTENRAGPARNLGASLACGEILLFLDSDILLPTEYLNKLLKLHKLYHIVSPVRKYLSEVATQKKLSLTDIKPTDLMETPWDKYLETLYRSSDWQSLPQPWMYFMTYALSISKKKFMQAGGFRTNYISYGYEDLDLGFRLLADKKTEYYNFKSAVYHLYHFESGNEYTLDNDFRYFQLAMSTRTFIAQNFFEDAKTLIKLATLKNKKQLRYYNYYNWKRVFINYVEQFKRST